MKNSRTLFQEVVAGITLPESAGEINSIAYFLLTGVFEINKTDILAGKMVPYSDATAQTLQKSIRRINSGEPVQYVLGEAYFFGRKFRVNASLSAGLHPSRKTFAPTMVPPKSRATLERASRLFI